MRLLVDLSGMIYRSAHKTGSLSTSEGVGTGIVYGVLRSLTSLLQDMQGPIEEVIVVWDAPDGKEVRQAIYPEYKANRKVPEEIKEAISTQRPMLRTAFNFLPVIQVEVPGLEADDVIGLLIEFLKHEEVVLVSGDSDLLQLIRYDNHQMVAFDGIPESNDLSPAQVVAYKCLVGDSSDNIVGVTRVGDKTARALLKRFKSLKRVMKHAKEDDKLGSMSYADALSVVKRNLKLIRLNGELVTEKQKKITLDLYRDQRKLTTFSPAFVEFVESMEFRSLANDWEAFTQTWLPVEKHHVGVKLKRPRIQSKGKGKEKKKGSSSVIEKARKRKQTPGYSEIIDEPIPEDNTPCGRCGKFPCTCSFDNILDENKKRMARLSGSGWGNKDKRKVEDKCEECGLAPCECERLKEQDDRKRGYDFLGHLYNEPSGNWIVSASKDELLQLKAVIDRVQRAPDVHSFTFKPEELGILEEFYERMKA